MFMNKKVLAAAIVGSLFAAGNAVAVDFTVDNVAATVGEFAREIRTTSSATTATEFTGAGVAVKWASGYAYSPSEVRYVRVEASPHVVFRAGTTVTATGGTGALSTGAINGLGSNVITFSVTAGTAGAAADVEFNLAVVAGVTDISDADIAVSLYDQPSQAQAGGTTGLITGGSVAGDYFSFKNGLRWVGERETHVADVEAVPSFTRFVGGTVSETMAGFFGVQHNNALAADSTPLYVGHLLNLNDSTVTISGDFSYVASAGAAPFNGAALARVQAFGGPAIAMNADSATFNINVTPDDFEITKLATASWNPAIPATNYTAKLNAVAASPTDYNVPVLGETPAGAIVRNGVELQAPLTQITSGYLSRLVLTNTSSAERPYTISILLEDGATVTTGTLEGTIPANGTEVINDLRSVYDGNNRATIVVNVAGPDKAIQGLYQLVNPETGSVSNTVMVRPGTN